MLNDICHIATQAGLEILRIYNSGGAVSYKDDRSPLTDADRAAHHFITAELRRLTPNIPVVSEESADLDPVAISRYSSFWLVDPLDGTKEFLKRTGDFTVNIALVEERRPTLGVIHVPVRNITYSAMKNSGAWKRTNGDAPIPIQVRKAAPDNLCVVASKDHAGPEVEKMIAKMASPQLTSMGSSLKFCLVAEGAADLYPRFVPTMEWDTAAADCILGVAGGRVLTLANQPLEYQKPGLKNGSLVAIGDLSLDWQTFLP